MKIQLLGYVHRQTLTFGELMEVPACIMAILLGGKGIPVGS
jgi:hypothetical protein